VESSSYDQACILMQEGVVGPAKFAYGPPWVPEKTRDDTVDHSRSWEQLGHCKSSVGTPTVCMPILPSNDNRLIV
jgi:hypothetical protein